MNTITSDITTINTTLMTPSQSAVVAHVETADASLNAAITVSMGTVTGEVSRVFGQGL